MDTHHRKIDLQSPADLTYLLDNIRILAQQKIDLAIPRSAAPQGEEDAYRTKVEELVQEYILQTFTLALPSLSINGFDASPTLLKQQAHQSRDQPRDSTKLNTPLPTDAEIAAGNYEAYDPRLAERLRTLYGQFEQQAEQVAKMRRSVPGKAAQEYAVRLNQTLEQEKTDKRKQEADEQTKGQDTAAEAAPLVQLDRSHEMEQMWRRGVQDLEGLGDITSVLAKLERAQQAIGAVEMA